MLLAYLIHLIGFDLIFKHIYSQYNINSSTPTIRTPFYSPYSHPE